jgi:hypothetical protein
MTRRLKLELIFLTLVAVVCLAVLVIIYPLVGLTTVVSKIVTRLGIPSRELSLGSVAKGGNDNAPNKWGEVGREPTTWPPRRGFGYPKHPLVVK